MYRPKLVTVPRQQSLQGLAFEEIHSKKYDEPGHLTGPLAPLSGTLFGAHAKSLEFISELTDDDIEAEMIHAELAEHQVGTDLLQPGGRSNEGDSNYRMKQN